MAFNRPGNSRDDKSGRSSNRAPKAGDKPKRSPSTRGNSTGSDQTKSSRPSKKYNSEAPGEKRSFSSPGKSSYDKPASSFSGGPGEKKAFSGKSRPYSGRPSDGESSGEKKAFAPKGRPYTGRVADNDPRPGKSFGGGDKKPFTSRKSTGSFDADDRPKRNFGGAGAGDKKPFASRGKSTGSFNAEDKPKRSFGGERTTDKKFSDRPATGAGFKRPASDRPYDADKPQRKSKYDKITPDRDAPVKTLRGRKNSPEPKDTGLIRLNRYISNAGICSRRKADELIAAGVVSVNGTVINELGHKVDPFKDEIRYNGELLKREKMVYVLLNKPKDYITTTEDPQERRTVMHLVEKASKERIYPVGRLDRNTTGLLLMTNDGDLADKLSHPRNSIVKLYQVELNKSLTQGDMNKIGFGLELEDGLIKPDSISYVAGGSKREVGIQIHSGKNRIVRRIFESLGYEVVKLDRAVYANLTKKDLPRGRWRFLEEKEVIQLKHLI
ncbi:pseudouridine synthase [Mucilaginibacter sp. BJC16-A38]|uniref:pseudouridine synthase n=1 Tax=Mucilaginibacter phenanthrenivorans TaxID=1234842 RepID=UPI0021572EBF|nr:pseudouridine synthase [Mucilaginibacter phenanthrenivorans]MCR8559124.1 pseudouridine synthase [Mucilaginibacter phenanthrenivorans]